MGLFQKKKAAIERALIEATHEIVCIFCFRNFDHNEVVFRAAQITDTDGYRAEPDKLLDAYRTLFSLNPMGEIAPILTPANFSEKNKGYRRGILTTLYDTHNNSTSMRICPYCHNNIPPSAGFSPSTIISLVGGSKAGKSIYFTSLIHTLKSVTSLNFEISCTPITGETGRKFKSHYEDPLITNGYVPDRPRQEIPQAPLVFTLSFADNSKPDIHIVFFEAADEAMADSAYANIYAAHIRNSSGMLFLIDPLQFHAVNRKILTLNHMSDDLSATNDPAEVLGSLVENYIYKQANGVSDIPTAAVLTKTDLLVALGHHGEYIHPRSNLFARYIHNKYFNLSQFDAVNYEADAFIHQADPNFHNALKRHFTNHGFFGASALGAHPELIHQQVAAFAPARVDEPFLWLLYKLGYIEGRYEEARP